MTNYDKKLIVILPPEFELYKAIEKNLKYLGFSKAIVLAPKFRHTFKTLMVNFVLKHILGRKEYKKRIAAAYYSKRVGQVLRRFHSKYFDYAIVMRPDMLEPATIDELLRVAVKTTGYQWDGLERFPRVFEVIPCFDRFFVFDPNDAPKYKSRYPNLLSCTNFYFDFPMPNVEVNPTEVMYAGAYLENRVGSLLKMVDELQKYNLTLNIHLVLGWRSVAFEHPIITFSKKGVGFLTYLKASQKAGILLDIKACEHSGLSFRVFEAIRYSKKLITDNKSVKRYDFYRPENIFVVEDGCFDGLGAFLAGPYMPLSEEIKQKYSFTNWLRYALDLPPYQATNSKT